MEPTLSSPWEPWMVAMAITLAATPLATFVGGRIGLVDSSDVAPNGQPMPRSGGLAIAAGFAGACFALGVGELQWALLGALAAFAVGLHDDFTQSNAKLRLAVLAALAVGVAASGVHVTSVTVTGGHVTWQLGAAAVPLSALWILGATVAFDFIDGLDGLAAGLAAIAGLGVVVVSMPFAAGQSIEVMALALCAAATGFLFFNRPRASVYMGDNGSNLLGFAVGVITLRGTAPDSGFSPVVGLLLIAVPVLDAAITMVRRASSDRSLFASDEQHLHHRLLHSGRSPVVALGILLAAASACAGAAVAIAWSDLG